MTRIFTFHSILVIFLALIVCTTAMPAPPRSQAVAVQSGPEAREYHDELRVRNGEEEELVQRESYPEARGYDDALGARLFEEGQLMGRTNSFEVRGYSGLDGRALGEEGQLLPRKVPGFLKKIGGFFKNAFNTVKSTVGGLVSQATGGGGGQ